METHFGFGRTDRLLGCPPATVEIDADPSVTPFAPSLAVRHELDNGAELTTAMIIARMGLVPTTQLQQRMARALHELGYHRVIRRQGSGAFKFWTAARPDPVSDTMRRVHQDADRAHGLKPVGTRPGLIARLIAALRWPA